MEPDDEKALVLARRTRKNLEFIYQQKSDGKDVEEFTQLLNSMLGMLICLREKYFYENSVTWDNILALGLQYVPVQDKPRNARQPYLTQVSNFSQLITRLRHSFAHNNFDLLVDRRQILGRREITGVRVWNVPSGTRGENRRNPELRTWEAELTKEQLKDIAYLFIDYLEETRGRELAQGA